MAKENVWLKSENEKLTAENEKLMKIAKGKQYGEEEN